MRVPSSVLLAVAGLAAMTAAVWFTLVDRAAPAEPDLGPVVRVELSSASPSASSDSTKPSSTKPFSTTPSSTKPSPPKKRGQQQTTRATSPSVGASTQAGARSVPRHDPAPAGDDDSDDWDDDSDDWDDDSDDDLDDDSDDDGDDD
ncbi:MAG: hypothetical protein L0H24_01080 [Microlunatus sp.]|nr:hypothetical protein [Microlunatus sp.]